MKVLCERRRREQPGGDTRPAVNPSLGARRKDPSFQRSRAPLWLLSPTIDSKSESRVPRRLGGFTLLETLVWLAIAAIAVSFVTLAVGAGSRPDQLQADAEKLAGLMQLAVEESVLTSKPIGLRFVQEYGERSLETRYEWSQYEQGKWLPFAEQGFFKPQQLMAGAELDMRLEGRAAELGGDGTLDANGETDKDEELSYKPDIFFLHSGEITPPLELQLRAEGIADEFLIEANVLGQIRLRQRSDVAAEWL